MLQGKEERSLPIKLTNRKQPELKHKYLFTILFIKHHPYREAAAGFFHFQSLRRAAAVDILSIFIGNLKVCFLLACSQNPLISTIRQLNAAL